MKKIILAGAALATALLLTGCCLPSFFPEYLSYQTGNLGKML